VAEKEHQEEWEIRDRCLALFVDDTGHEGLKGQPVYGLGGCAALGRDIEHIIRNPWRAVRKRVAGSPDVQLHANKFRSTPDDVEAIATFFRAQPFWRFGAIMTTKTKLVDEISLMRTMKGLLQNRINEIAAKTLCKEVIVIFEASERADGLITEAFQDFQVSRGCKRIPSRCGFMPKSAAEPALEVADFVMHAVGRQARHNLTQRGTFVPDFCAVFHGADPELTSFTELEAVVRS
jgi:hypothetical protein